MDSAILVIALFACGAVFYLLPTIVSANRKHPNTTGIGLVNVFLGWTMIGWVAAIVWAFSGQSENDKGYIKCPNCAEVIKQEAKKCRYCQSQVS